MFLFSTFSGVTFSKIQKHLLPDCVFAAPNYKPAIRQCHSPLVHRSCDTTRQFFEPRLASHLALLESVPHLPIDPLSAAIRNTIKAPAHKKTIGLQCFFQTAIKPSAACFRSHSDCFILYRIISGSKSCPKQIHWVICEHG